MIFRRYIEEKTDSCAEIQEGELYEVDLYPGRIFRATRVGPDCFNREAISVDGEVELVRVEQSRFSNELFVDISDDMLKRLKDLHSSWPTFNARSTTTADLILRAAEVGIGVLEERSRTLDLEKHRMEAEKRMARVLDCLCQGDAPSAENELSWYRQEMQAVKDLEAAIAKEG